MIWWAKLSKSGYRLALGEPILGPVCYPFGRFCVPMPGLPGFYKDRFDPAGRRDITDWLQMEEELTAIVGRKVDLVDRASVERSPNYIRRSHILHSLEPLYVA